MNIEIDIMAAEALCAYITMENYKNFLELSCPEEHPIGEYDEIVAAYKIVIDQCTTPAQRKIAGLW